MYGPSFGPRFSPIIGFGPLKQWGKLNGFPCLVRLLYPLLCGLRVLALGFLLSFRFARTSGIRVFVRACRRFHSGIPHLSRAHHGSFGSQFTWNAEVLLCKFDFIFSLPRLVPLLLIDNGVCFISAEPIVIGNSILFVDFTLESLVSILCFAVFIFMKNMLPDTNLSK